MIAAKGYKLVPVALGYVADGDLFQEAPRAGRAARRRRHRLPNDPVNTGHALLILQEAGLITLKPDVGTKATLRDVTANPRKLRFRELEGSIVARALDDVDAAVIYPGFVAVAGVKPESALYAEGQLALCHPLGHAAGKRPGPAPAEVHRHLSGARRKCAPRCAACTTT